MSRLSVGVAVALALLQSVPARADFQSVLVEHVRDHISKDLAEALKRYFQRPNDPEAQRGLPRQIVQCAVQAIRLDEQHERLVAEMDELATVPIGSPRFGEITRRHTQDQHEFDRAAGEHRARCQ